MVKLLNCVTSAVCQKSFSTGALIAGVMLISISRGDAQILAAPYNFSWTTNNAATNGDGSNPGTLILSGDSFFGATVNGGPNGTGTIFRVQTNGMNFSVLHYFAATAFDPQGNLTNSDGANPAGLILSGGTLYGAAPSGGLPGKGTVFSVSTNGQGFVLLHEFTVTDSNTRTNPDGSVPSGNLILSGGTLYGTGTQGGTGAGGTLFGINTNTLAFTNLFNFEGTNGAAPAIQVLAGGTFYATAAAGGQGSGLLFKITTNGTGWTLLHNFSVTLLNTNNTSTNGDGAHPVTLILSGDTLYGAAMTGGAGGEGSVFSLDTNGLVFNTLHSFAPAASSGSGYTNADGTSPDALFLSGNSLGGAAGDGGGFGSGTVFALGTNGAGFATLYNFAATMNVVTNGFIAAVNNGGSEPNGGLIPWGDTLYGAASLGGLYGNGTIFALTLTPIPLLLQQAGDDVILNWTNSLFSLQASGSAAGPFTNVPAAASPFTNGVASPAQFFRLVGP